MSEYVEFQLNEKERVIMQIRNACYGISLLVFSVFQPECAIA